MADVLVIIVAWNGLKWAEKCIGSVQSSTVPADILVVDNGSTDGMREWLEARKSDRLRVVFSDSNLGFGKANNIGLRMALEEGYKYAYLLNQDAWVMPDTFEKLIAGFSDAAECPFGVLSPVQMTGDMSAMDAQFARHCGAAAASGSDPAEVNFVMAAHWMICREAIEATGGFSPAFDMYGEDDNWLDRARFHGFRAGVVPAARAVHDRDARPRPKKYRMRLKYVHSVVRISDPSASAACQLVLQPLMLIAMSVRHLSFLPLAAIPKLLGRSTELLRYRKQSLSKGAFLPD